VVVHVLSEEHAAIIVGVAAYFPEPSQQDCVVKQLRRLQSEIEIDEFIGACVNYCVLDHFFLLLKPKLKVVR
jgi:hypothetical protein